MTLGGSEMVLAEWLRLFPEAPVFTLLDRMNPADRSLLRLGPTRTSWLQRLPGVERYYRALLPLFPAAARSLHPSNADLILSNSHAAAKGVRHRPDQLHLSYCLSPMRYAWDLRQQYLREAGLDRGLRAAAANRLLDRLREWDRRSSRNVTHYATLSHYVADRIRRAYGREATVIYPPVDTEFFTPGDGLVRGDRYFTMSRFVPYKRMDMIAAAFAELPGSRLVIAGDGPDRRKVLAACGPNVEWIGRCSRDEARRQMRACRAFLFAAEEDFGIAPLEAQACGAPVIAYGRGGATETVQGIGEHRTGLFFHEQTPGALAAAIRQFEALDPPPTAEACRANAERFSAARFRAEFKAWVDRCWEEWSS